MAFFISKNLISFASKAAGFSCGFFTLSKSVERWQCYIAKNAYRVFKHLAWVEHKRKKACSDKELSIKAFLNDGLDILSEQASFDKMVTDKADPAINDVGCRSPPLQSEFIRNSDWRKKS